jgi:uncharacterized protein YcbK (DUF882 family)
MRYFTPDELKCQHCGAHGIDTEFVDLLDSIRAEAGFAFPITSGYRCPDHPIEARKAVPGAHATGKAVDIGVSGDRALRVIELALSAGIERIGVNQKGSGRFIHLDVCTDKTTPAIWSY